MNTIISYETITVNGHVLRYWIDHEERDEYSLKITGWALVVGIPNSKLACKIDFKGLKHSFSCRPHIIHRHDVNRDHGRNRVNYTGSGFLIEIPRQNVGQDCYNIYLTFRDKETNEILVSYAFLATRIN
jgi:hypothetical protein